MWALANAQILSCACLMDVHLVVYLDFSPRALNLYKCLEGASRIGVVGWVVAAHWLLFRCLCLRKQPRNS